MTNDYLAMFKAFVENHRQQLQSTEMKHNTIVINAFAGPGAGKTTSAWEIASALKKAGFSVELAPEYAKELVWTDRADLLDGSEANQLEVLQEQTRRIDVLYGKVDFILTDSPLILNSTYLAEYDSDYEALNMELFAQYHNFSYYVERDPEPNAYEPEGRIHSYEQSLAIDEQLKSTLKRLNIYVGRYNHSTINKIVSNIIKHATGKSVVYNEAKAEPLPLEKKVEKKPSQKEQLKMISSEEAAIAFASTDELEKLLAVIGRFNYYSANNLLLITAQCPYATVIKTYDEWQTSGYNIKKGQKHFSIVKREEKLDGSPTYYTQQMFDITQTDADPTTYISFKPTEKLLIKALISIMSKGTIKTDGSKTNGECVYFNPNENVIYVEKNLPARVLINALAREIFLYDIAGSKKYDRQKNIGIATASAYAFCCRYGVDATYLDLDYSLDIENTLDEKSVKSKIDSIKGHTKDLSIRVDRFIERVQKKEFSRG